MDHTHYVRAAVKSCLAFRHSPLVCGHVSRSRKTNWYLVPKSGSRDGAPKKILFALRSFSRERAVPEAQHKTLFPRSLRSSRPSHTRRLPWRHFASGNNSRFGLPFVCLCLCVRVWQLCTACVGSCSSCCQIITAVHRHPNLPSPPKRRPAAYRKGRLWLWLWSVVYTAVVEIQSFADLLYT